jgi:hydrogenase/urease accessory protein HupE
MIRLRTLLFRALLACILVVGASARADEFRPAYLELKQIGVETYDVLWKVPAREDLRLALYVRMPEGAVNLVEPRGVFAGGSHIARWRVRQPGGLEGKTIVIDGLTGSASEVLARIERADGSTHVTRLMPARPAFVVEASAGRLEVARTYLLLGIEHILLGFDHLLFVLALLVLVRGGKRIVLTVTAFTVAHSVTLMAATLGWVALRGAPVEATIALSIVFLAREIAMTWRGHASLTERMPWLVAFVFGLLHGLGFAGALAEIGLPQNAIPLALLCYNAGVEVGQMLFVGAVLAVVTVSQRWLGRIFRMLRWLPAYAIGGVASYWLMARVAAFGA